VQKRFGTPDLPNTAFCPNCHVKITPGTQICDNCNSRICTHCYQVIPSMTANVCPNCGKRDFLKKSLKDIRIESSLKKQTTESFTTETEYHCPICSEKMVLLQGGTLKCQSRSCGYLIALKEFLDTQGKQKIAPAPPPDTFGIDIQPPREKTSPKFFEVAKSKVRQKMDTEDSTEWEDTSFTTSIETKANDQYFWKSERLGKRRFGSGTGDKGSDNWESGGGGKGINIEIPWRKVGIAARFVGLIALVVLVGFGIFAGVRAIIDADIFDGMSFTPPITNDELIITSLQTSDISHNTVTISWETSIPAIDQVEYGISDSMGYATEPGTELTTMHSITINGLEPETTYHFMAVSSDNDDQVVYSAGSTFTTLLPPDNSAPIISEVKPSDISDIAVTITWKTDESASSKIEYGTASGKYTHSTDTNINMQTEHFLKLTGLSPSTTYHFVIKSADASNNEAVSKDYTFTTSAYITEGYDTGERALDFTLPTLEGSEVTLSQYRGQIVLLNFWFTTCGACVKELPYIEEIHRTWIGNKPLTVLTVHLMGFTTNIKKLVTKNDFTFPVLLDTEDTEIYKKYGVMTAPKTFFIDTNGIIRQVQRGPFKNAAEITEILDSL
jgi:peroxiredoxin